MTDKGIIVDGIDVSECECFIEKMDFPNNLEGGYYNQNNLCECGVQGVESYPFFCKDNSNCYYKQLKRKEQALDKIENSTKGYCKNMCMTETKETCESCQNTEILGIINKVKEEINEES